jgi:HPt (histidine-containing phosphotransfer) domain-containing protein
VSQSLSDYFVLEANEFLDQLDALLAGGGTPDAERFFRLARGVRGSARVAQEEPIAAVAEALEGAARALQERTLAWSEETRALAVRTVDDLRVLVRARGRWTPAEDARAREAAARWTGVSPERGAARPADGAEGQFTAFLRREVMGVVSELDHASESLRRAPAEREPLREVVRRMRPLRGMTGVDALAPVQEVLEGVEETAGALVSRPGGLADAHLELLAAARTALAAALAAVERGGDAGALPELARFRDVRERLADAGQGAGDDGVIPVSALFYDDAGPHIVSSPLAPVPASGGSAPEEVERFLRLEATGFLDRAEALLAIASARRDRSFGGVAGQLAALAQSVGELSGTYGMAFVASAAGRAADELRASGSAEEARAVLARLRASLPGAGGVAAVEPDAREAAPPADPRTEAAAPVEATAPAEDGVVPVESLLFRGGAALREALSLRPEIERLAAANGAGSAELRGRLEELFDLITLGMEEPAGS